SHSSCADVRAAIPKPSPPSGGSRTSLWKRSTMPRPITAADATPVRVAIVTLDSHLAGAVERARPTLLRDLPGLSLNLHAVAEWGGDEQALAACRADVEQADIVIASMLFMEDHIQAVLPWLEAKRERCDAIVCGMSAGEVIRLTRLG